MSIFCGIEPLLAFPMRTRDSQYAQYEAGKTRLARGLRLEQISIHAPLTVVSRQIHKRKMG